MSSATSDPAADISAHEAVLALPVVAAAMVDTVARLAHEIWYEYYVPILGRAQVDYMVSGLQSATAISEQIERGQQYFLLQDRCDTVGYFAIESQPAASRMFLAKFYLRRSSRGRGIGRRGLAFIEAECHERGLGLLWLNVNKFNPAVEFYERLGFVKAAAIVTDIGSGYVMDDYRMEKKIR